MGTREIILTAVIPAVIATLLLAVVHAILAKRGVNKDTAFETSRGANPPPTFAWLVPILLAAVVMLGAWAWQSRVELWPESVTHRFPAVVLAAMLAGLISTLTPMGRSALLTTLPALAGGGFVAWAFLGALHESLISEPARWGWIAGVAVITAAQSWAIETGAKAMPGWRAPALLWLLLGVTALGATAGFANAPLVLWPAAAVCFALAVAGLFRRDTNLLRGVGPALAVLIAGTITFSNWFGDRERFVMFALLMATPLPLALAALPVLQKKKPVLRLLVSAIPALGLAGVQAAVALPELIEAANGAGDEYDYDY